MIKSMTGFGQGESDPGEGYYFRVELRSINHRYLDIAVRLPREIQFLEERVRRVVQQGISRGRVDVFVSWRDTNAGSMTVLLNRTLAQAYHRALCELSDACTLGQMPDMALLSRFPDVLSLEKEHVDLEAVWSALASVLNRALVTLLEQRGAEGERLVADMLHRLRNVELLAVKVAERSPVVTEEYRQKLAERLKEYLGGAGLDQARLLTEAAVFADRSSITEELVRLQSHLESFRQALAADAPAGRKLDFIAQELFREINTAGAKASDFEVARMVIEMKTELEKVREQVQNIE